MQATQNTLKEVSKFHSAWSRSPGKFLTKGTRKEMHSPPAHNPVFHGSVRDWYQSLVGEVVDMVIQYQGKNPSDSNGLLLITSPEVARILSFTSLFPDLKLEIDAVGSKVERSTTNKKIWILIDPENEQNKLHCATVAVKNDEQLIIEIKDAYHLEILDLHII